jgi:hypothetical protein
MQDERMRSMRTRTKRREPIANPDPHQPSGERPARRREPKREEAAATLTLTSPPASARAIEELEIEGERGSA